MEKTRGGFSSKIGFVLAAAGSAVGLGNLWRFPYLAAQYGGGIFLLVYIIIAITFGFALMITEIAIGRKTGSSAIVAFKKLDKKWGFLGVLASLIPVIILPYYSVIGGWVLKYMNTFLKGQVVEATGDKYFSTFIAKPWEPILWFSIFIAATTLFVFFGVEKGVENASKFMMPLLVVLTLLITVYVVTRPGSMDDIIYYIKPDFTKFSVKTVLAALGQLFYSMSLAMGIMITYGSYMKKEAHIEQSVRQIEIFDTAIAFMAGLMIVPSVFSYANGDVDMLQSGPGLMFITLPKVFADMTFGRVIGSIFFLLVLFAALTSAISLMETIVSIVTDRFKLDRKLACLLVAAFCILVGIPSSLGFGIWSNVAPLGMSILDFFDFISNSIMMPIVALLTCIFVGFVIKPKTITDEIEVNGPFKMEKFYHIMISWVAPICIIAILVTAVLGAFGILKI